jgi:hypothetical protein
MALEIKSPPVLEGKAARDFYKKVAEAKCSKLYVNAGLF